MPAYQRHLFLFDPLNVDVFTDCSQLERQLIDGCRRGEARFQEKLFKHFYGYVMGISLRYASSRQQAQEILNDSFLKVFDSITSAPDILSFKAWLRRIVVNTALDAYRRNKRLGWTENLETAEQETSFPETIIDQLTAEEIIALLDLLPTVWKLVFNLHEIEGYGHEEIGRLLSFPASHSRTYLTRARQRLRTLIQQRYL